MASQVPWNAAGRSPCCCDCDCSLQTLIDLGVIPFPSYLPEGQSVTYDSWTGARTGLNGASQWPDGEGLEHHAITESDYFSLCGGGFLTMVADSWSASGTSQASVGEGLYPFCTGGRRLTTPFTVASNGSNTTTFDLGKRSSTDTHGCRHTTNEARDKSEDKSGLYTASYPNYLALSGSNSPSFSYTLYWHGGDDEVRPQNEPKYSIKADLSGYISAGYFQGGPGSGNTLMVSFRHRSWSQALLDEAQSIPFNSARNSGVSYGETPIQFSVNSTTISVKGMRVLFRSTYDVALSSCGGGIPYMTAWSGNGILSASYSSSAP